MRVIDSDNVPLVRRLFRHLQRRQSLLVAWQVDSSTGKREVFHATLGSFHTDMRRVSFSLTENHEFDQKRELFFYAEDGQFIFKTDIQQLNGPHFIVSFPKEIKLLEEPDARILSGKTKADNPGVWETQRLIMDGPEEIETYVGVAPKTMAERTSRDKDFLSEEFGVMSLDEEDKMFADKRESIRIRPKANKTVKVLVKGEENIHIGKLFDLSQGGMAFLTMLPESFTKGSEVVILGFNEFDLDDPLHGVIMSQRPADDMAIEHKIGIKFSDGQA